MGLDLHKLFIDVFHPQAGEQVLVMTDAPRDEQTDNELWAERREMATQWHAAFESLGQRIGFGMLPLVTYPAVGSHNGNLPLHQGAPIPLESALFQATLTVALTEFSATAPMVAWAKAHDDFRAATLPTVARRMEETALAADYADVARRCREIAAALEDAERARVLFSTGHEWTVDLRHRDVKMDDGQLPRHKPGVPVINLPSGESFQVPYEGERTGEPSRTEGEIPVPQNGEIVVFVVKENRIVSVRGNGPEAAELGALFEVDPARRNIAEFALGCNPKAVVWGNVLEDEKAGFHWAYGRSEHLGGTVGPEDFLAPEHIVHQDIVYASDSPIQVASLMLFYPEGEDRELIRDGQYLI